MFITKERIIGAITVSVSIVQLMTPVVAFAQSKNGFQIGSKIRSFNGATSWLNTQSLSPEELKGKVVAIDFYTSGCSNCQAAVPHMVQLYNKYKGKGLVVIGVHTPESSYEKELGTVTKTATRLGINYPIAIDNQSAVWSTYQNSYWPNLLIFNKEGKLVYEHAGEGQYDEIDKVVDKLL